MGFVRKAGIYIWHTMVCLAVLALLLGLYWSVAYSVSMYRRRRAEQMLQQLAALKPGIKNPRSAQQIAKDLGGKESCFEEACSYDFDNKFAFSDSWPQRLLGRTAWDYFGLRPWLVSAVIGKADSEPTDVHVMVAVGWNRGFDMWSWRVVDVTTLSAGRFDDRSTDEEKYSVTESERQTRLTQDRSYGVLIRRPNLDALGGGEALSVYLSSAAPSASRRAAFDINLRCATSRTPCDGMFQLVPSLRPFYERTLKNP
jgi:hypothetical protein